jgi:hypothetical protein
VATAGKVGAVDVGGVIEGGGSVASATVNVCAALVAAWSKSSA